MDHGLLASREECGTKISAESDRNCIYDKAEQAPHVRVTNTFKEHAWDRRSAVNCARAASASARGSWAARRRQCGARGARGDGPVRPSSQKVVISPLPCSE
ncbi:hypothetical protein EVAR_76782_1 [Eumeta japonica]|uniref:Uncharacterized protein n=1 Tax=Eumeta variegata TaxID=151549 RepID=A0A4C1SVK1_EUMVA|nr:hypothetical protein EVAR_76782_1 [Eumeta japonica]